MNHRRAFIGTLAGSLLGAPFTTAAQPAGKKVWRIGFLAARARPASLDDETYGGFPRGMRELGYVEGKNLVIEWRFADGKVDRLPELAQELVSLEVDVIVSGGTPLIRALQRTTATIPIVAVAMNDPLGSAFATSLVRPGGNITGLSLASLDISPKQLELLRLLAPKLSRIGVMTNPDNTSHVALLKSFNTAAQGVGVNVVAVAARNPEEIERGFAQMANGRAEAFVIPADAYYLQQRAQFAQLSVKHRVPMMSFAHEHVEAGGLMSYGQDFTEFYGLAAGYVDKILKGAKPQDMPIEQPATFKLVVNMKAAKTMGVTVPQELLLRADEVIQ